MAGRSDLDEARALTLAQARHRGWHEGSGRIPRWTDLPERDRELVLKEARDWLRAAASAGLVPPAEPPSPEHDRVYVDDEGFLYTDYRTVPAGDEVVRVVWDEGSATSRRELEIEHGATFTHIGWCK